MQITHEQLKKILENRRLEDLDAKGLYSLVTNETALNKYLPDGFARIDPRDGAVVLYNSARSKRPHEYAGNDNAPPDTGEKCPVCNGKTTGVIDLLELSEGYTFINKNLFPLMHPQADTGWSEPDKLFYNSETSDPAAARGVHLLQWTSSVHDKDWHNMTPDDCLKVMQRLAVLEKKLLTADNNQTVISGLNKAGEKMHGYVSIIKNFGKLVGGSLPHGHQQIAHGNVMPRRFADNADFASRQGLSFSNFAQRESSADLLVKEYETAVILVPPFIRRPFNSLLVLKDTDKSYLHELSNSELRDVAQAWRELTAGLLSLMPAIGREPAYNITVNNGPGCGLYFEFLPYTQETGGYEHLGLWICQSTPEISAEGLREYIPNG